MDKEGTLGDLYIMKNIFVKKKENIVGNFFMEKENIKVYILGNFIMSRTRFIPRNVVKRVL